jgi:cytochrome c-type biogenesis protein CcmF
MTMPLGMALLFLMAVAPVLPWRKASGELLRQRLQWPAWAGTLCVVFAVAVGARGWAPLVAFGLGGFGAGAAVRQIVLGVRRQGIGGLVGRTNGGMVVHLGVILIGVAFAASAAYGARAELRLRPGESAHVLGHEIRYDGARRVRHVNRTSVEASVRIDDADTYQPSISNYTFAAQTIGTPSVRTGWREDVYLTLISAPANLERDVAVIGVNVQPLVMWLWVGGGIIALGTALASVPTRRRRVDPPAVGAVERPAPIVEPEREGVPA